MAEIENALEGLQMRPGWVHAFLGEDGLLRARRWDPGLGVWHWLPVAEWGREIHAEPYRSQIVTDPTDPTWTPPHNPAHGARAVRSQLDPTSHP